MIILKTLATAQALSVIPRDYLSTFTMVVRDDSTNVTVDYQITSALTSGNYLNFNNIFSPVLIKNHFYDIELVFNNYVKRVIDDNGIVESAQCTKSFSSNSVMYKDRIFCTDQDIDQLNDNDHYELNKGQFTTYNGFDNTYIVI